ENDVWSHRQLLKVVSHTPIECEKLLAAQAEGAWVDVARERVPMSEKVYTWWSYRAAVWTMGDRGRRLDHVWVSPSLKEAVSDFPDQHAGAGDGFGTQTVIDPERTALHHISGIRFVALAEQHIVARHVALFRADREHAQRLVPQQAQGRDALQQGDIIVDRHAEPANEARQNDRESSPRSVSRHQLV